MVIFDFWKKRADRLSLNQQILRLKQDFQEEIKDFEHFKQLQIKKIEILRKIKDIWNRKWKEAEELIRIHTPNLIREQLRFIGRDINYIAEEDFILRHLLEIEKRRNSTLGSHLSQNVGQEYIEFFRSARNSNLIIQLRDALRENSSDLKRYFWELRANLDKQLQFLKKDNSWRAINQNEELLEHLKEEDLLTQRIEHVINDVTNKIRDIIGFELERIREESRLKELRRTKIYVRSVDCELTLEDIEKIVKGELPLFYYHGTSERYLDSVFQEKCLIPLKRLELLRMLKELKREKSTNWRHKVHELIAKYNLEYKRDINIFKKLVILKEESSKLVRELLGKVLLKDDAIKIHGNIIIYKSYTNFIGRYLPHQLHNILVEMKRLIIEKLELMAEGKEIPYYLIKKGRELKNKAKKYVMDIYVDLKNLRPTESQNEVYKNLDSSEDFREYFKIFFGYIEAYLIADILSTALDVKESYPKLHLFDIRDKWFVFFGANLPYKTRTNFESCIRYVGAWGIVFEFKPTLKPFIKWLEIQPSSAKEDMVGTYGAVAAAEYGRLTYDLIADKKIDFRHLLRIYTEFTSKEEWELENQKQMAAGLDSGVPYLVDQKMKEYGINVPLYTFGKQPKLFQQAMDEMKQILISHGLSV